MMPTPETMSQLLRHTLRSKKNIENPNRSCPGSNRGHRKPLKRYQSKSGVITTTLHTVGEISRERQHTRLGGTYTFIPQIS